MAPVVVLLNLTPLCKLLHLQYLAFGKIGLFYLRYLKFNGHVYDNLYVLKYLNTSLMVLF